MTGFFFIGSRTRVDLLGLKDEQGNFINTAVISGDLQDSKGNTILNPIPFDYVASSNGDYVGYIPSDTPLKEGNDYTLVVCVLNDEKELTVRIKRKAAFVKA